MGPTLQQQKKTKKKKRAQRGSNDGRKCASQKLTSCRARTNQSTPHNPRAQKPTKRVPERGCSHAKLGTSGCEAQGHHPHPPCLFAAVLCHTLFFFEAIPSGWVWVCVACTVGA